MYAGKGEQYIFESACYSQYHTRICTSIPAEVSLPQCLWGKAGARKGYWVCETGKVQRRESMQSSFAMCGLKKMDYIQPTTKFLLGKIRKGTRVYWFGVFLLLKCLLFCCKSTENFPLGKVRMISSLYITQIFQLSNHLMLLYSGNNILWAHKVL